MKRVLMTIATSFLFFSCVSQQKQAKLSIDPPEQIEIGFASGNVAVRGTVYNDGDVDANHVAVWVEYIDDHLATQTTSDLIAGGVRAHSWEKFVCICYYCTGILRITKTSVN